MDQTQSVITLNSFNTVQILSQFVEVAQQKGAFKLNEAEILKRATDVLLNDVSDHEINDVTARQLLVQGVIKGQSHGAYTLNDAALLSKVVQYVTQSLQNNEPFVKPEVSSKHEEVDQSEKIDIQETFSTLENDLSDLADPIPLKPKEI